MNAYDLETHASRMFFAAASSLHSDTRRGHLCGSYGMGSAREEDITCPTCKRLVWANKLHAFVSEIAERGHILPPHEQAAVVALLTSAPQ